MKKKGQSLLEYAILLAVVLAAFAGMRVYIERATQANIRLIEDQAYAKTQYGTTTISWIEGFDLWEMILYFLPS